VYRRCCGASTCGLFLRTECIYVVLFLCTGDDEEQGRRKRSKTDVADENKNGYVFLKKMATLFRERARKSEWGGGR
jgi:hypothetical protein